MPSKFKLKSLELLARVLMKLVMIGGIVGLCVWMSRSIVGDSFGAIKAVRPCEHFKYANFRVSTG